MGNFIYPVSATRKMYGQAGRKAAAQAKRYNEMLSRERNNFDDKISSLKSKVTDYQKLPWYKKLWLAIREFFGHSEPIIPESL